MKKRLTLLLATILAPFLLLAQSITGNVSEIIDGEKKEVAGVSIQIEGVDTVTTKTDEEGNFIIDVEEGTLLTFSASGFNSKEVKATKDLNIEMELSTDGKVNRAVKPISTAIADIVFYSITLQSEPVLDAAGNQVMKAKKDINGKLIRNKSTGEIVREPANNVIGLPIVLIVLVLAATYFTVYFGFPNITKFKLAIDVVRGKYDSLAGDPSEDENNTESEVGDPNIITVDGDNIDTIRVEGHHGEVTAFQALTAALSATVGLGNIAGVAIAIAIGGAGATFWMILAGFIGMASKFVECTLGVIP
jgi:hypothetical protein